MERYEFVKMWTDGDDTFIAYLEFNVRFVVSRTNDSFRWIATGPLPGKIYVREGMQRRLDCWQKEQSPKPKVTNVRACQRTDTNLSIQFNLSGSETTIVKAHGKWCGVKCYIVDIDEMLALLKDTWVGPLL